MRLATNLVCAIVAAVSWPQLSAAQSFPLLAPAQNSAGDVPKIFLSLPKATPSENLHGRYIRFGAFGGSGGFIKATPNVTSYQIEAGVDGTAASEVRIVLYAEGCETQKFGVLVSKSVEERAFVCEPLPTLALRGEVSQFTKFEGKDVQIEFDYLAEWACEFFGLQDCMVPTFVVASVVPQSDGLFSVALPDLYHDTNEQAASSRYKGKFKVIVRERRNGNILAFLRPRELLSGNYLKVADSYPAVLQFEPQP